MIDLVVPFVESNDPEWQKLYKKYKGEGGAISMERFRSNGTLKFFFRSVEKNLFFVNKIFLIVQSETQIPSWLDTSNPKLRIVYHKDFMPEEYLPTFNSNAIEMFLWNIEELSENFIYCNDDMFFINSLEEANYFDGETPLTPTTIETENYVKKDGTFNSIEYNSAVLSNVYCKTGKMLKVAAYHYPIPYKKSVYKKIFMDNKEVLLNSISGSRFRTAKNIGGWFFRYCMVLLKEAKNSELIPKGKYLGIHDYISSAAIEKSLDNADVVCFNDRVERNIYSFIKVANILNNKFRHSSSYEKLADKSKIETPTKKDHNIRFEAKSFRNAFNIYIHDVLKINCLAPIKDDSEKEKAVPFYDYHDKHMDNL